MEAHATDIVFGIEPRQHRIRSLQADMRRCHICGEAGHIKNQCPRRSPDPKPPSPPRPQRMPLPRTSPSQRQQWQTQQQKPALRCFLCNRPGHIARKCMMKPTAAAVEFPTRERGPDESQREDTVPKTLDSRSPARCNPQAPSCREHNRVGCTECSKCHRHRKAYCTECSNYPASTHHCPVSNRSHDCYLPRLWQAPSCHRRCLPITGEVPSDARCQRDR